MAYNHEYPYVDPNRYNSDWELNEVKSIRHEMETFEALNKITFSGEWDITKQYPAWTIVNDNNGRDGYISIQPVPAGVTIDNIDYWRGVANYSDIIADLQNRVIVLEGDVADNKIWVTPEEFGAVGDGVTDDTQAMQDAIDYAIANHCSVLATKNYSIDSVTISTDLYDGLTFFFNRIYGSGANTPLIVEGQSIVIYGNMLVNENGNALQLGGANYAAGGVTVNINLIRSSAVCMVLKATSAQNVQDCVFNISRMIYTTHAVYMDTTDRYIGEITFNNTWFTCTDPSGGAYAIYCDCVNYGMTGLTLNACSFEGCGNGIQVLNTSPTVQHQFMPLNGFGLRVSELTEGNNKTFLDYHGTGRLIGSVTVDSANLDSFVFHDDLAGAVPSSPFTVYGRLRLKYGSSVFSNKATLTSGGLEIAPSDTFGYIIGTSTYTEDLPISRFSRCSGNVTLALSSVLWEGDLEFLFNTSGSTLTVNNVVFTTTANFEILKVKALYFAGVGIRYIVEQAGIGTIISPL